MDAKREFEGTNIKKIEGDLCQMIIGKRRQKMQGG